jgi:hypothetical protein
VAKTFALASLARRLHDALRRALAAGRALAELDLSGARRAVVAVRDAEASQLAERVREAEACIEALVPAEAPAS